MRKIKLTEEKLNIKKFLTDVKNKGLSIFMVIQDVSVELDDTDEFLADRLVTSYVIASNKAEANILYNKQPIDTFVSRSYDNVIEFQDQDIINIYNGRNTLKQFILDIKNENLDEFIKTRFIFIGVD